MKNANPNNIDGGATNIGKVRFTKGTKERFGTCNFCNNVNAPNDEPVHELAGQGSVVRICDQCLKIVYAGPKAGDGISSQR